MIGITAIYPYIPRYRMDASSIHQAWGRKEKKGSLAFSNYDEDTITMAINTLSFSNQLLTNIDFLIFSTTSNPFIEGNGSNIIATALGLREDCYLYDLNQSLRSGTKGLELGYSLLKANERKSGLIIAADNRTSNDGSELEASISDGACALEIGNANVVAEIKAFATCNDFSYDTWQLRSQDSLVQADTKFSSELSVKSMVKAGREIIEKEKLNSETIDCLIVSAQQSRLKTRVAKELGIITEKVFNSELDSTVGYTGVSAPFFVLNEALLKAKSGEKILVIHEGSGSGVEAFLLDVTDEVENFKKENRLSEMLKAKIEVNNYNQFLVQKGKKSRNGLEPFSTTVLELRERRNNYQLKAQKCTDCGAIHFPARNSCSICFSRKEMEWLPLAKYGTIFTFTHDHLFPGENIVTTMAVIDLDDGGRIYTQVTDYEHEKIKIGGKVQLSFRKIHEGGHFPNYFWKAIPVKEEESCQKE